MAITKYVCKFIWIKDERRYCDRIAEDPHQMNDNDHIFRTLHCSIKDIWLWQMNVGWVRENN